MNQRKPNKTLWYSMGLALLLCAAALVTATGTTFARYRTEREKTITFQVRPATQLHLGVVRELTEEEAADMGTNAGDRIFDPDANPQWETDGDTSLLRFAVANGVSDTEYSPYDMEVTLQLVATLGFWEGESASDIYLRLPSETAETGYEELLGKVTAIDSQSPLYTAHGGGWIYTFQDTAEEELSWRLAGGELSCVEVTLVMKNAAPSNPSLLQLKAFAEIVGE